MGIQSPQALLQILQLGSKSLLPGEDDNDNVYGGDDDDNDNDNVDYGGDDDDAQIRKWWLLRDNA